MDLTQMTKEEILEAIDVLHECNGADPEIIYQSRSQLIEGESADKLWERCHRYRQPLIDYVYRDIE